MARHWSPNPVFTILVVCTGNVCRSAMAERLAHGYLAEALGEQAGQLLVTSAGTRALRGAGVHPDSAVVLSGFGGDPVGHAARQLVDDMAIDADLTLTMTRQHRRAVLQLAPRALQRTFTLHEAADVLTMVPGDLRPAGETLADRSRALVKAMAMARSQRPAGAADDVVDPVGRPEATHQEVLEDIVQSLVPLLERLVLLRDIEQSV